MDPLKKKKKLNSLNRPMSCFDLYSDLTLKDRNGNDKSTVSTNDCLKFMLSEILIASKSFTNMNYLHSSFLSTKQLNSGGLRITLEKKWLQNGRPK